MERNCLFYETSSCLPPGCRERLAGYLTILRDASAADPPPYGEASYRHGFSSLADRPNWFSSLLYSYAEEEAAGAARLLRFSGTIEKAVPRAKSFVVKHAKDEARHVLVFLRLLDTLFPEKSESFPTRRALEERQEALTKPGSDIHEFKGDLLHEVSEVNVGEVKNRVHLSLLRTHALKYCDTKSLEEVDLLTLQLIRDEVNHIIYTGSVFQQIVATLGYKDANSRFVSVFSSFNRQLRSQLQSTPSTSLGDAIAR